MIKATFLFAAIAMSGVAPKPAAPAMAMWRIDCGQFDVDNIEGRGRAIMPVSCYLIRHGDDLVLFDAGLTDDLAGKTHRDTDQTISMGKTIAAQLKEIGIDPAKVGTLVISHYHGDHTGQANVVANARLLMGAGDVAYIAGREDKGPLKPWIEGQRPVEQVSADRDLFGDGTVRLLYTPGHTPGHLALLVKLPTKAFILTGDFVHFRDQLSSLDPPGNHVDKVRGKAEIERMTKLAADENATIVVGHEMKDIALLPTFPTAAK